MSRRARQDRYIKRESRGPSPRVSPSLAVVLDVSDSGTGVVSVAASGLTETASGGTGVVSDLLRDWFGDIPQAGFSGESCSSPGEACASATVCAELTADWGPVGGVGIAGGGGKTANQSSVITPSPVFTRSFCGTSFSTSISTSTHRQFGSPLCNPLHTILHRSPTGCSIASSCRHLRYLKGTPRISMFLIVLGRTKAPLAL